ncbi:MAG: T9SS type A sorting domain-containing protein [Flavobacteriales bacterium]|nr:T9SS type A sorting domain-containing protein [Flavobacteriales bacterium]
MNRSVRFLGALLGLLFMAATPATAQDCLNLSQYPGNSIIPDPFGAVTTISTCSFEAEYSVVTNIVASGTYEFTLSSGGYITVRQGTYDGPVLAQGLSPVQATAVDGTDLFPHWNVNAACSTLTNCVTTTVEFLLNCEPPQATATFTEDCDQQIFYVDVDVTSTGDSSMVNIMYDVFGNVQYLSGVGVGTYQLGPFFFGEEVAIVVEHETDPLCNWPLGTFAASGECPVQVLCGTGPLASTYCYTNNEARVWNWLSLGGSGSLVLSFFSGTIETSFNDQLIIYDGPDGLSPILFQHTFTGNSFDLTGLTAVSTSGTLHMELFTNGFNSCSDGVTTEWNWQVECLNCQLPQATATNVDDCVNNQFSIPVDVTSLGDGSSVTITYSVNGNTPVDIPGVGLGQTVIGPFTINDVVSVFVGHEFDPACNLFLGSITDGGDCPNLIVCGAQPLVENYCYVANDSQNWSYLAQGSGTLRLTFNIGTIESNTWDHLRIYDGTDATGTLLFDHTTFTTYNLGPAGSAINGIAYPYYGLQYYSISGSFYMEMSSDGSVQCGDPFPTTTFDSWEWEVVCLDCSIPVAGVTIVDDCANSTYTLDVDITDTGSGTTASLEYDLDGTPQTPLTGLATGVTTLGPFNFGEVVALTLAHESNSLCNINLGNWTDTGTCPLLIDCDGTTVNDSACYANSQDLRWYYQGTGTYPLGIYFVSGDYEFQDSIIVYDGGDITAPILFAGGGFGLDMTGQFFYTTNVDHRLCVRIFSNTFTSCAEGFVGAQTEWQIACLDCVPPAATFAIVQDCDNFQYYVDVAITDAGTDPDPVITNSAGLPPTTVTGAGTYQIGPFVSGTQVQLTVENDANSLCNVYSGTLVNPLCPIILCGATPLEQTYCYTNLENTAWAYATPDGNGTIHLYFDIGTIESNTWDDLIIYDGPDASGTILFNHGTATNNLGPVGSAVNGAAWTYETVDVTTTSGSIYMTLTTDGSVACNTNGQPNTSYDPWVFKVQCLGCSAPGISYNLVADCLHREYKTEVIVTAAPSPDGLTVTNTETGEIQTASGVGILYFGPYSVDTLSLYTIVDESSPSCVWLSDSLTFDSDSCHIVSCGFDNYSYCYENDEDRWYTYQSAQPVPTTIAFAQGQMLSGDRIWIYNGPDEGSSVIYQGTNGGNLSGFAVNSQNPQNIITLRIQSDATGSCEDGQATAELQWYVGCGAVGIEEIAAHGFSAYPNPTDGVLYISVGNEVSGQVKVRVLDMSGRTVIEQPLSVTAGSTNAIDMASLQSGQYMVQLTTATWTKTQRVQVAR